MDPHIQDFEPRVLKRTAETKESKRTVSRPTTVAKVSYDEDGNEVIKLKIVSREMAQFIVKSRNDKGLKQDELAKQSNLDKKTISDIERGGCVYNAIQINRIADALGVKIPRK